MDVNEVRNQLTRLFEKAQATDEFEFCCSLLRVRGMEGPGWDPLVESDQVLQQILSLTQAPLDQKLRIRLILFLYCHVTEMDDLYAVVGNMLRICMGHRYDLALFTSQSHPNGAAAKSPHSKIERIVEWSKEAKMDQVGEIFQEMFVRQVRNAFFHSDYILHGGNLHIKKGEGVPIDSVTTPCVPLEWLVPKMNLGINLALSTIGLMMGYRRSYKQEKTVQARMGPDDSLIDVLLTVEEGQGLVGFQSS